MTQSSPTDLGFLPSSKFWQAGHVYESMPSLPIPALLPSLFMPLRWILGWPASHLVCFSPQGTPASPIGCPLESIRYRGLSLTSQGPYKRPIR